MPSSEWNGVTTGGFQQDCCYQKKSLSVSRQSPASSFPNLHLWGREAPPYLLVRHPRPKPVSPDALSRSRLARAGVWYALAAEGQEPEMVFDGNPERDHPAASGLE